MSLGYEYFEERSRKSEIYRSTGKVDLDTFLEQNNIDIKLLYDSKIVEKKIICSTADLYDFNLTKRGKKLIHEDKEFQIFIIKDVEKFKKEIKKNP